MPGPHSYQQAVVLGLVTVLVAAAAHAIPNQAEHPHADVEGATIAFIETSGADPDQTNHSHVGGIPVTMNGRIMSDGGNAEPLWLAHAAWDDRAYRYQNGDADLVTDLGAFGHGFTSVHFDEQPRYRFDTSDYLPGGAAQGQLDPMRTMVREAVSAWNAAAQKEGQASRTAPDGTPLVTNVSFVDQGLETDAEVLIDFVSGLQSSRSHFAEWMLSPQHQGNFTPNLTLAIEANPSLRIFVDDPDRDGNQHAIDWEIRVTKAGQDESAQPWVGQAELNLPWHFGQEVSPSQFVDVDYRCVGDCGGSIVPGQIYEGIEAEFRALGLRVGDNAEASMAAGSSIRISNPDLTSVVRHEWGHVIGLLHSPEGIMNEFTPFTMGNESRFIDEEAGKGAAVLYSIPRWRTGGGASFTPPPPVVTTPDATPGSPGGATPIATVDASTPTIVNRFDGFDIVNFTYIVNATQNYDVVQDNAINTFWMANEILEMAVDSFIEANIEGFTDIKISGGEVVFRIESSFGGEAVFFDELVSYNPIDGQFTVQPVRWFEKTEAFNAFAERHDWMLTASIVWRGFEAGDILQISSQYSTSIVLVPTSAPLVPEPATVTLLALAAATLQRRWARQRLRSS